MTKPGYSTTYRDLVRRLKERIGATPALQQTIGGEFVAVGKLEHHLLRSLGLADGHLVVDVGCGTGRLAAQLAVFPAIRYVGCDVVPALLDHAKSACQRPDWQFVLTEGAGIPVPDGGADFVCFFSVFTHLLHVDSYRYLGEARRALRPGGRAVFSFLEFRIAGHWNVFVEAIKFPGTGAPLNQFIDRDAIAQWAAHLDFDVEHIWDGDKPHIPIPETIIWEGGQRMEGQGHLGQSVAVLQKRT